MHELRGVVAVLLATASLAACSSTSADSACSMAFIVTFRHVDYDPATVTKGFTSTRPLGTGTLPTCHADDAPEPVRLSAIPGVDPSVALVAPHFPHWVLLSVPPAQAPPLVASHLRWRPAPAHPADVAPRANADLAGRKTRPPSRHSAHDTLRTVPRR